jgi:gliding motility-associated lipoprotein GldB
MKFKILTILSVLIVLSCSNEKKSVVDVSNIQTETIVKRFDQEFYTIRPENLNELKSEFPYLFPQPNPDSVWVNKLQNKDELALFEESQKLYADFSREEEQLDNLFKHIKYFFPQFNEPKTITILTNVDYENNVVLSDSLLFISLDNFLGKDNEIYDNFPDYVKQNYTKDHLIVAVAEKFVARFIPPSSNNNLIARMIQEGKKLALTHAFLPSISEHEIIGYTEDQLIWADLSETEIWKYFVQNEMLYNSDTQLAERFIDEAPFSKFFLEIDQESPGRIGIWFGWQIVKSYLKNNKVPLQKVMLMDNEEIFNNSKYKPKK